MAKVVISGVKDTKIGFIKTSDYSRTKISERPNKVKIDQTLPFRVKFINIGVPGYSASTGTPIGIAVIGVNNYIA